MSTGDFLAAHAVIDDEGRAAGAAALKLGRRSVRYDLQRVREALSKFEQEAIS